VSSSVVAACNRTEAFLSSSVPYLQFDGFSVEVDCSNLEVNPDCGYVVWRVGLIRESEKKTRLPYSRISDEEKFEEVVVFGGSRNVGHEVSVRGALVSGKNFTRKIIFSITYR